MEGRFRQREQTDRGEGEAKGAYWPREAKGKGSRLTDGRLRRREPDDGGNDQVNVAD